MGFGRPKGKPKEGERDVKLIPGRMGNGVCVCVSVRCVFRRAGTRGPFHTHPQLKPRYEVKSENERREGLRMTGHKGTVCGNGLLGVTKRGNLLYEVALHPCDRQMKMGHGAVCWERGIEDVKRWS